MSEQPKEYSVDDFRKEIEKIVKKEMEKGTTAHFKGKDFDPAELTAEDMLIWIKIKDGSVTEEDYEKYRLMYKDTKGFEVPARHGFLSLAGSMANSIIGRRWLEEEKRKAKKE